MSLLGMIQGLNRAGIRYVVIGGVAATAHGSVRVTDDLDICFESSKENREKLAEVLRTWRAYLRKVRGETNGK